MTKGPKRAYRGSVAMVCFVFVCVIIVALAGDGQGMAITAQAVLSAVLLLHLRDAIYARRRLHALIAWES